MQVQKPRNSAFDQATFHSIREPKLEQVQRKSTLNQRLFRVRWCRKDLVRLRPYPGSPLQRSDRADEVILQQDH